MGLAVKVLGETVLISGADITNCTLEPTRPLAPAGCLLLVTFSTEMTLQLVLSAAVDQTDITAMLTSRPLTTTSTSSNNLSLMLLPSDVILIDNLGSESEAAEITLELSTVHPTSHLFLLVSLPGHMLVVH